MAVTKRKEAITVMSILTLVMIAVFLTPKVSATENLQTADNRMSSRETVFSVQSSTLLEANFSHGQCESKREIAKSIMANYQQTQCFYDHGDIIRNQFTVDTMSFAIQLPVMETQQEKTLVINSFGDMIFDDCING